MMTREAQFLKRRLLARVDGVPEERLPPPPRKKGTLPPPDCKADARLFDAVETRADAAKVFGALSEDEQLTFFRVCAENPPLAQKLVALSLEIVDVSGAEKDIRKFKPLVGKEMSPEIAKRLQAFCERRVKDGIPTVCLAVRKAEFGGWTIQITPYEYEKNCNKGYTALICEEGRVAGFAQGSKPPLSDYEQKRKRSFEEALSDIASGTHRMYSLAILKFRTSGEYKKTGNSFWDDD